jgi:phage baseplate assembly protein W
VKHLVRRAIAEQEPRVAVHEVSVAQENSRDGRFVIQVLYVVRGSESPNEVAVSVGGAS